MNRQSLYLFIAGPIAIVAGVALWSAAAAAVLAGLMMVGLGFLLLDRPEPTDPQVPRQ